MAVYVHKMEGQGRVLQLAAQLARRPLGIGSGAPVGQNAPTDPWFVLTADTDDELHAMAASLGLARVMFRPGTASLRGRKPEAPRYPITMGERDRAMALGAQLISGRKFRQMLQRRVPDGIQLGARRARRS
jgi:hypothetical protein